LENLLSPELTGTRVLNKKKAAHSTVAIAF